MNLPLRVPNHGPYIEDSDGGATLQSPGKGFQLRSAFVRAASLAPISGTSINPLTSAGEVTLEDVALNVQYRAALELHAEIQENWTVSGSVEYFFEYSADGGTTFTSWDSTVINYTSPGVAHDFDVPADVYLQSSVISGGALTGLSVGDDLIARVSYQLTNGVSGGITFPATPGYVLQLIEEVF